MYPLTMLQTRGPLMGDAYWAQFPDVLSIDQLARILRKSSVTIWRWLPRGQIPAHKIGSMWIVYRDSLRHKIENPDAPYSLPVELLDRFDEELSASDLGQILGITKQTVYRGLNDKTLPGHQYEGHWLIYKSEIVQLLEQTSNQLPDHGANPDTN